MEEIKKVISIDTTQAVSSIDNLKNSVDDSGKSFKSLKEYKQYIDQLKTSMIGLDQESAEYKSTAKQVVDAQDKLNNIMKDTKKQNNAAEGSYDALNKELNDLKKQFKATGNEAERAELATKINKINDNLKEMDASIGNYQRNVGNYSGSFTKLGDSMDAIPGKIGSITTSARGLGKQLSTLAKNPIGIAIAAVALAVMGVVNAFKNNEEATNKLKTAFSAFQPIIDAIKIAFDKIATVIADIALKVIPKAIDGFYNLGIGAAKLLNKLGLVSDETIKDMEKTRDAAEKGATVSQEIVRLEQDIAKRRRQILTDEAKDRRDLEELKAKINDEEKYSLEERTKFAQETEKINEGIFNRQKKLAEDELALINHKIKVNGASTELLDQQAEAQAKIYQLEEEYYSRAGELISERVSKNKELKESYEQLTKEQQEWVNSLKEEINELNTEWLDQLVEDIENGIDIDTSNLDSELSKVEEIQKRLFENNFTDEQLEIGKLTEKYNAELALLQKHGEDTTALTEEFEKAKSEIKEKYRVKNEEAEALSNNNFIDNFKKLIKDVQEGVEGAPAALTEAIGVSLQNLASFTSEISSIIQDSINQRLEAGEISQEQAEKEFENGKKVQIAATIVQGLAGVAAAIAQGMALPAPFGAIIGAANAAVVATTTALQISKIKATKLNSSSSNVSSSSASVSTAATGSTFNPQYTTNVSGANETENLSNAIGSAISSNSKNTKVYILESDIQDSIKRVETRESEATF